MPGVTAGARADIAEAIVRTAWATGSDLLGKAVDEAPIDIGHLRESGDLRIWVNNRYYVNLAPAVHAARLAAAGNKLREVAFEVGFHTPYAAAQHEGHAIMHRGGRTWRWAVRRHPKGGKSKYLSDPFLANVTRYVALMQSAVDQVTAGGPAVLERLRGQQGG